MNETEIFAKAIAEENTRKRSELVDQLCVGDGGLKDRVEKLLDAHENPQSFFENPVPVANHVKTLDPTLNRSGNRSLEQPGSMIGPYKLLQQIGEGGMGIVYMAEQIEPVKRRVALKIIKPGMDSRQIIARFEAERQALAMMDHPNIAKVLDAGTTDGGHPYFVMELVNGMPITEYCDQEQMPPADRLKLFVSVCRAVQHAHQKGIIHRDLKPSNILVTEYDGQPVAKIIDFGVAKATGSQLTDKTLFTEFGQVIGTLEYMSPEQARRNQLDVDTRSDIYSLGIVLYTLLTGETPFGTERLRDAAWDEMLKIIREEEPQRPSVRLSSSQTLAQVASRRGVEPKRLSSLVRGDLDWIVMKTLQKDRNRRYASANELADDISRHLTAQPLIARPPSTIDRLAKFARRNRRMIMNTFLVFSVVAVMGGWQNWNVRLSKKELKQRTEQITRAINESSLVIAKAEASTIGADASWDAARAHCQRIEDLLSEGKVEPETTTQATKLLYEFEQKLQRREIATQLEEVVINGATNPDLESWVQMESDMRELFRAHGFDLDNEKPSVVGERIRENPSSEMWSDLLELWIGTRGQMAALGGPKLNAATMQPWADAIYVADDDLIRTGIRKFIYEGPRSRDVLDELVKDVDLKTIRPRTLAWLAATYSMIGANDQCEHVFEVALNSYPTDLMLNFDYGYVLADQKRWQEAARMYHRCLALRSDVPGIWKSLAKVLQELGETKAAEKALARAKSLEQNQD